MAEAPRSAWRLVKVPAILTLVVTVVRLVGELAGGPELLFGSAAGGGLSLIGIGWLMPIFGVWFGWRLVDARRGPDRAGLSAGLHLLGIGALIGGLFVLRGLEPAFVPSLVGLAACGVVASAFAWRAWGSMARVNLLYGLCARLPVVLITLVVVPAGLGTHYAKLPPDVSASTGEALATLIAAQLFLWVPGTILVGGFFGSLAAGLRRQETAPALT